MSRRPARWDNYDKYAEFWKRVEKQDECLVWTGTLNNDGYGSTSYKNKPIKSHRLAYILILGDIPEEHLDHLCRNRKCVNPEHLEPVTNKENIQRGYKDRTTCKKGHPRIPALMSKWRDSRVEGGFTYTCKLCRAITSGYDTSKLMKVTNLDA